MNLHFFIRVHTTEEWLGMTFLTVTKFQFVKFLLFIPVNVSRSSITDTFIFNSYQNQKNYYNMKIKKKKPSIMDTNVSLTTLFDNHMELLYRWPIAWITITIYIPVCNEWIVVLYTDTFTAGVRVFIC